MVACFLGSPVFIIFCQLTLLAELDAERKLLSLTEVSLHQKHTGPLRRL